MRRRRRVAPRGRRRRSDDPRGRPSAAGGSTSGKRAGVGCGFEVEKSAGDERVRSRRSAVGRGSASGKSAGDGGVTIPAVRWSAAALPRGRAPATEGWRGLRFDVGCGFEVERSRRRTGGDPGGRLSAAALPRGRAPATRGWRSPGFSGRPRIAGGTTVRSHWTEDLASHTVHISRGSLRTCPTLGALPWRMVPFLGAYATGRHNGPREGAARYRPGMVWPTERRDPHPRADGEMGRLWSALVFLGPAARGRGRAAGRAASGRWRSCSPDGGPAARGRGRAAGWAASGRWRSCSPDRRPAAEGGRRAGATAARRRSCPPDRRAHG